MTMCNIPGSAYIQSIDELEVVISDSNDFWKNARKTGRLIKNAASRFMEYLVSGFAYATPSEYCCGFFTIV